MLFITLPNGQKVRLPRTGETVQVQYTSRPEWGWLPALVDEREGLAGESASINVVVFNRKVWPGKVGFHQSVPHSIAGESRPIVWRHVPEA